MQPEESKTRKSDKYPGCEYDFAVGLLTKTGESERMDVPEHCHVAKVCVLPIPTSTQGEVPNGRKLVLLEQCWYLPIAFIPDVDEADGLNIWAGRKIEPFPMFVTVELSNGESLE